jgi:hypothetical protein
MRFRATGLGLMVLALTLGASAPASAELFNCHQRPGQVLYSYSGSPGQYSGRSASSRTTSDFAASSRRQQYQTHATSSSSRHYGNDRSRW